MMARTQESELLFRKAILLFFVYSLFAVEAYAQSASQKHQPLILVLPSGRGGIVLPDGEGWEPQSLSLRDEGRRVIALVKHGETNVSYVLDGTAYKNISSVSCRNDTISPIEKNFEGQIKNRRDGEIRNANNQSIATTEYLLTPPQLKGAYFPNLFGFVAYDANCSEIHISQIGREMPDMESLRALVLSFAPKTDYTPSLADYMRMGSAFFKQDPASAVPYYRAALQVLPHDKNEITIRRIATDQLVMSLGMSGNLKESQRVAEEAIKVDPEYPLNYYMLACNAAEQGNAVVARKNLALAWERRANVIPGEKFPDPVTDDSFLRLKKNKEFWSYVTSLK